MMYEVQVFTNDYIIQHCYIYEHDLLTKDYKEIKDYLMHNIDLIDECEASIIYFDLMHAISKYD